MLDMIGIRHGDLLQRSDADTVDRVEPPFGRLFGRSRCTLGDEHLKALADHMNWVDQAEDPSSDSNIPAGYTVLGAFITHDLSFNTAPLTGSSRSQRAPVSQRTPRFDLDSIYAPSPLFGVAPPWDGDTGEMWYREQNGSSEADDLPRWVDLKGDAAYARLTMPNGDPIPDGKAIIGDVRNDEHVLIAQMHLAFLKLHNRFVAEIRENERGGRGMTPSELRDAARRRCEWYYQWVVVNDYLPRIVGRKMIDSIMHKRRDEPPKLDLTLYETSKIRPPIIPIEFTAAAFRFGHSMVRAQYRVNSGGIQYPLFSASDGDDRHLGGGRRLPAALVVDWSRFFSDRPAAPEPAGPATSARNFARKIDTRLNELLAHVPKQALPPNAGIQSLALLDLKRAASLELPSGQEVAQEICHRIPGFRVLSDRDLGLDDPGLREFAPLWFYVLREAECFRNKDDLTGEQLGPIGGRIVAEAILGLLGSQAESYFNQGPEFAEYVPTIDGEPIRGMIDLLRLADPTIGATT